MSSFLPRMFYKKKRHSSLFFNLPPKYKVKVYTPKLIPSMYYKWKR